MASRGLFLPGGCEFAEGFMPPPRVGHVNGRPIVVCYPTGITGGCWTFIVPSGLVLPPSIMIYCTMASALTGTVVIGATLETITPDSDPLDLDAAYGFLTPNSSAVITVPANAGQLFTVPITLTNHGAMAVGDLCRLVVNRQGDNASDTAAGDLYYLAVELRDAA